VKLCILPLGLFFLLAACGGGGSPTGAVAPQETTPTPNVQLMDAFRNLNTNYSSNRTHASTLVDYEALNFGVVSTADIGTASATYAAFDQGLKGLIFPASMKADVAALLRADAQVEADYQGAVITSPLGVQQVTLATFDPDVNAANAATIVLSGDMGFPPGQ